MTDRILATAKEIWSASGKRIPLSMESPNTFCDSVRIASAISRYSGSIPFTSSFADPRSVSCSRRYVVHPSGLSKRWLTFFPKPTPLPRIRRNEQISNPLTEDIKVLFYSEFKVAETLKTILRERLQIEIDDHEVGYVALHIHSAIGDEKVSVAMQTARAVRECIDMLEKATGKPIDVLSLSYNRLMNHMKYMVARASTGEKLNLDMNEYMLDQYPQAYKVATDICKNLEECIGHKLDETETGYLAMHIQRVYKDAV